MTKAIFKLWLTKPTEAWYQLSADEQAKLFDQVNAARAAAGGKIVLTCDAAWASEQWLVWGVEQFPDSEAIQKYAELLNAFNWLRYMHSMSVLGTEMQDS